MWKYYDVKIDEWVINTYKNIIEKFKGFIGPELIKI
jgi:hypothetical protein